MSASLRNGATERGIGEAEIWSLAAKAFTQILLSGRQIWVAFVSSLLCLKGFSHDVPKKKLIRFFCDATPLTFRPENETVLKYVLGRN